METFWIKALQLIVALLILVTVHEFGHYIFARIFGIRVNRFYLFFNPWFSLLKYHPDRGRLEIIAWTKKQEDGSEQPRALISLKCGSPHSTVNRHGRPSWAATLYGLGWLPLGGYCDIAGMIDETKTASDLASEPQPWEFRSKNVYQRFMVMVAGVLFNFILAIVIYAGIAWHWGERYVPLDAVHEGYDYVDPALQAGFQNGDIPLAADGTPLAADDPSFQLRIVEADTVTVLRQHADTVAIAIPDNFIFRVNEEKGLMAMRIPVVVNRTVAGGEARRVGLLEGDRILAVDTLKTPSYTEFIPALKQYAGRTVPLAIQRADTLITVDATPDQYGKLGFQLRDPIDIYPTVTKSYNALQAIPKGWDMGTTMLTNYVGSMKHVFTKEGAQSLGGFGTIGDMFPERWNWYSFWTITAFLSVVLAFMNIIPIPGLDGGHMLFTLWEMVTRRKPSEQFLMWAQYIGMGLLLVLLFYANANDVIRLFR